jgi:hypothetical protein
LFLPFNFFTAILWRNNQEYNFIDAQHTDTSEISNSGSI